MVDARGKYNVCRLVALVLLLILWIPPGYCVSLLFGECVCCSPPGEPVADSCSCCLQKQVQEPTDLRQDCLTFSCGCPGVLAGNVMVPDLRLFPGDNGIDRIPFSVIDPAGFQIPGSSSPPARSLFPGENSREAGTLYLRHRALLI